MEEKVIAFEQAKAPSAAQQKSIDASIKRTEELCKVLGIEDPRKNHSDNVIVTDYLSRFKNLREALDSSHKQYIQSKFSRRDLNDIIDIIEGYITDLNYFWELEHED